MSRRSLLLIALWGVLGGAPLAAQQRPGQPPDTAKVSPSEALRARQRALLERLARPPGQDTLELRQMDTLPVVPVGRPVQPTGQVQLSRDSVVERLMRELVGYQPVEYAGAEATFDAATRNLVLRADSSTKVTVRYQDRQVTADTTIRYYRDLVEAVGNPVTTTPGEDPLTSRRLLVDTRSQRASAFGARTETSDMGARWFVTGDLPRVGRDTVFASGARFTSDEQRVPYYHFAATNVKIVRGSVLVAMPVRLYFGDVPVLWLPFVAQSLSRGRASGLLTPRFSLNDVVRNSNGYQRRISNVGFYWAMNQYMDATVAMDWFSSNYTAMTTGLNFRVLRHFLQGGISARQFWPVEGPRQLSLNGQQSWEISERMNMNASIAYASSSEFVRRNTFDPLEATQQIRSTGGFSRRFDWGALNILGSRSQSLSDDRVEMTLPQATFSIKPITLFRAPVNRAAWYNNAAWSGGGSVSRRSQDYDEQPDSLPFLFPRADQALTQGSANHSISLGNLSLGQNASFEEATFRRVPRDSLSFFPGDDGLERVDIQRGLLSWSTSLSYQQTLIGQTSITPNVTLSSQALRADTLEVAQQFVSAPTKLSFGASLRSQLYGFFPGFGPFEAIRHRVSPGITYNWAPEVEPTDLQRLVFGSETLQPTNEVTFSFSQTFEAKRRATDSVPGAARVPLSVAPALPGLLRPDSAQVALDSARAMEPLGPGNPTRPPQGQTVTLLSLNTSSISYDFVQADSAGGFIHGFRTTMLRTEIGSDYLRGLNISFEHEIFRDSTLERPTDGRRPVIARTFSPHLRQVNLRFSLNQNSGILRRLGLGSDAPASQADLLPQDPFANRAVTDEASILPGSRSQTDLQNQRRAATQLRDWNASVSYALTRPRSIFGGNYESSQMVNLSLSTSPTRNWRMSWRTAYDLDRGAFNDHMVSLTRDLHRWQANFDFMKTTTGNWQFRFEVTLLDASDLRFDYDQRSVSEPGRLPPP